MVVSFFGHRRFVERDVNAGEIIAEIEKMAEGEQVQFYLGEYGCFDAFAHRCAKKYKKLHPETKIIFVTPYIDENYYLLQDSEERYDEIIYPELENVPKRYAIDKRNKWIVENSDFIFFYVIVSFGGASNALTHARRKNIPHKNLYIKEQ